MINKTKEIWRPIKGYEGLYKISNFGRVFSFYSNVVLNLILLNNGYFVASLHKDKKMKRKLISRQVAIHFIPNPKNKSEVNHIDGNPKNNHIDNLEWMTHAENIQHSYDTGLRKPIKGESHWRAKLNEKQVRVIRHLKEINPKLSCRHIGEIFGFKTDTIGGVIYRNTWRHI